MVGSFLEEQPVENAAIVCAILNQLLNCFLYNCFKQNVIQRTFHYKSTEQKHDPFGLGCLLADNGDQCLIINVKRYFHICQLATPETQSEDNWNQF